MVTEANEGSKSMINSGSRPRRNFTDKEARDKKVIELYKQGLSCYKIADKLNIHRHTVTRILAKYGINRRTIGDYHALRHEKIIALYEGGHSIEEIADTLNITPSTVIQVLERYRILFPKNDKRLLIIAKYLELKHKGMSKAEIAKEVGINIKQLNRLIFNSPINISNLNNKKYLSKPISEIIIDCLRGESIEIISKKYDIKQEDLEDLLVRFGLLPMK
ncbi:MAG: helix-turn-helix domain-containing protein [Candidatus Heimdallarchaeaceae archaeon]